jgi:hypothetical protein
MAIRRFRSGSQTEPMGKGQMAEYVANCPRCRASRTTFDVPSTAHVATRYSWQRYYEAFCLCRHCSQTTTFLIVQKPATVVEPVYRSDDTVASKLTQFEQSTRDLVMAVERGDVRIDAMFKDHVRIAVEQLLRLIADDDQTALN